MQTIVRLPWIPSLNAEFHLAADGYSTLLVALTLLLTALSGLVSRGKPAGFHIALWLTALSSIGAFLAVDLLLFFVFWELTLIPMYFVIALWGAERRHYAAMKFLIYTNLGGVLMLLGILGLYREFGTFNYFELLEHRGGPWIFWAFVAGCAVKIPMFPLHTWLPAAHTEAPTAGSVVLAGVMLKLGTYGLVRFAFPLAPPSPEAVQALAVLSIVAILYGALVCLMQTDWKRLIAYSSVSHMGFCTLGLCALNRAGVTGSMLQQLNHGVTTGLLFLIVGAAYDRRRSRNIADFGGLSRTMPNFTLMFLIAVLGSMGMPPLNGFIGELTILQGVFAVSAWWGLAVVVGILLGAAYLLWLFQRVSLGDAKGDVPLDLSPREWLAMAPLAALTIAMGVYPAPLFSLLEPAADAVLRAVGR